MMNKTTHGQIQDHLCSFEKIFIHKDILQDFNKLQEAALASGLDIQIISGFRSFQRQKDIWNKKVSLNYTKEEIEKCLRWSAIPGFSRHHWGTDLDIVDKNPLNLNLEYKILLEPHEYESHGIFSQLGKWLDQNIKDSLFFRPYSKDLGGVACEPWHISHRALSSLFINTLTLETSLDFLNSNACDDIHGRDYLIANFEHIYHQFIINIT